MGHMSCDHCTYYKDCTGCRRAGLIGILNRGGILKVDCGGDDGLLEALVDEGAMLVARDKWGQEWYQTQYSMDTFGGEFEMVPVRARWLP